MQLPFQRLMPIERMHEFPTFSNGMQVGAALSMVYTSGAPVMFVGCGQTYTDLKRLNVKSVVRSLLK